MGWVEFGCVESIGLCWVDHYLGHVFPKDTVKLTVQLLSHTLPNLKETVNWYEKMGAEIIRTNYKENQGKSNNAN